MDDMTVAGLLVLMWLHGLYVGWLMWRNPKLNYETADPLCTYCKGLGYDASGYACTCVKEKE